MFPYLLMLVSGLLGIVALLAGASLAMEGQQEHHRQQIYNLLLSARTQWEIEAT